MTFATLFSLNLINLSYGVLSSRRFLLFFQQNIGDAPVFGVQIPVLPQPGTQGQPPAGLLVEDAELLPGQEAQLLLPQPGAAGGAQPPAFAGGL